MNSEETMSRLAMSIKLIAASQNLLLVNGYRGARIAVNDAQKELALAMTDLMAMEAEENHAGELS